MAADSAGHPRVLPEAIASVLDAGFGIADYMGGFPHVFSEENAHWTFPFLEAGEPLAFCAAWPLAWLIPQGGAGRADGAGTGVGVRKGTPFPAGALRGVCIGSVVTAESHRGKGFAGRVLERAVSEAFARGCDLACLFSEKKRLYEEHGFRTVGGDAFVLLHPDAAGPGGAENAAHVAKNHAALSDKGFGKSRSYREAFMADLASLDPAAAARLWRALCRHSEPALTGVGWREFLALCAIPDMTARWIEKAGEVVALVFTGKGRDFENVMHGLCAASWDEALFLLGECRLRAPERTVTLLVESFAPETRGAFRLMRTEDVGLMVRARDESMLDAFHDAFRAGTLRVRGLQSC